MSTNFIEKCSELHKECNGAHSNKNKPNQRRKTRRKKNHTFPTRRKFINCLVFGKRNLNMFLHPFFALLPSVQCLVVFSWRKNHFCSVVFSIAVAIDFSKLWIACSWSSSHFHLNWFVAIIFIIENEFLLLYLRNN